MHCRLSIWATAICIVCLPAAVGVTQPKDPQVEFDRAVELATGDEYAKAVAVCHEIIEALPAKERSKVHKLLGYSYKKLEMLPEAWHHLTRYLESSGKEDTAAGAWLEEVEAALKQGHVKVSFSCDPPTTTITLPSSALSTPGATTSPPTLLKPIACPAMWWLSPGKHKVAADAPEYEPRMVEVDVRVRGDSGVREIRLEAIDPIRATGGGESHAGETSTTVLQPAAPKRPTRALEWTLLGSGLALGVTGAIFHGLGYSKNESLHSKYLDSSDYPVAGDAKSLYDKAYQDQVRPKEITAYVLYGVGGAAVLAGVVTWFIPKSGNKSSKDSALTFVPLALPGGTGALMTLEF